MALSKIKQDKQIKVDITDYQDVADCIRSDQVPANHIAEYFNDCLLYTSPSPRDRTRSRMPSSA